MVRSGRLKTRAMGFLPGEPRAPDVGPGARQLGLVLALILSVLACSDAVAQPQGQVTKFDITDPSPTTFTATNPFRTNRDIIRIKFTHNGSSGNYFISTQGADVEGSTFLPQPSDTSGSVLAGFLQEGVKTINLVLLQTRLNVVAQTTVPLTVFYDLTPPTLTLNSIQLGTGGRVIGLTTPPPDTNNPQVERVVTPNPIYVNTNTAKTSITANAVDNATPPAEVQLSYTVPQAGLAQANITGTNGVFTFDVDLSATTIPDGNYDIQVRANDQVHNPTTAQLEPGNRSGPVTVKIIKDTRRPRVSKIEICRQANATCSIPAGCTTTGATTYVGNETIQIKITFDEKLTSPPRVSVLQANMTNAIQAPPTGSQTEPVDNFTFVYVPIPTETFNGPAQLQIVGEDAGANNNPNNPGFGTDLAGNGVTATSDSSAAITIANVFVVDTVPPDTRRAGTGEQPDQTIRYRSEPFQGQVVTADTFPTVIRVRVRDYVTAEGPAVVEYPPATGVFPSGVDFNQLAGAGSSSTTTSVGNLGISLTGPTGTQVPGMQGGQAPTEVTFTIGDYNNLSTNGNFVRDPVDGVLRPREGTWTITTNLVDRVCNRRQRIITFQVDTTPIRESSLTVTVGNARMNRKGSCVPAASGQPQQTFPQICVSSTDADFWATSSRFEVLACFNGNDSPCYPTVISTPTVNNNQVCGTVTGVQKVDPTGIDFPVPKPAPPAAFVPAGELDPRLGRFDGPYTIRVKPQDAAGNRGVLTTEGRRVDYLDWDVNLDTIMPYTQRTFPLDCAATNAPLRFVDATMVDPPVRRIPRTEVNGDFANPTFVSAYRWVRSGARCGSSTSRTPPTRRSPRTRRPTTGTSCSWS
ncbi:MAG: hypothetical protein HY815_24670 [Candidatus Riflebacteria bacterium]|nr:hypothetical protein [Candidatus Riflebacteria bacterium]